MKEYTHLNIKERETLFMLLKTGISKKDLALKMKRHRSTIYRELDRNTTDSEVGYLPDRANNLAMLRKVNHGLKVKKSTTRGGGFE